MNEIHYLLGNSCNLACEFCFWDMRLPDEPWKTKKLIVDEIVATGITKVTISGGEPTCTKDFLRTLKYMIDQGLEVILHTNGLKVNEEMAKELALLVKRVSLSLDGSDADMCSKMRTSEKSFDHTLLLIKFVDG